MRPHHRQQLIQAQIAAIPPSPKWHIGQLDDVILPFELRSDLEGKWYPFYFSLINYNLEPPVLRIRKPGSDVATHDPKEWPPNFAQQAQHPITKRPFVCMAGLRDYHSHPLHLKDSWDAHRNFRTLDVIISDLSKMLNTLGPKVQNVAAPM